MSVPPRHIAGALLWNPALGVLLQHRDDRPGVADRGKWSLFGGGMEAGEDAEAAMLRELEEELGFVPGRYHPFLTLEAGEAVFHLFLARIELPLEGLTLSEGQGFAYLAPVEALAAYDLSDTARLTIEVFQLYRGFRSARGLDGPIG
ncbi:MAG TPA: NUDIX domain-containing protein [Trueperaceae bacterium]|nr:NUDIX domain-containing protein [Trueperaceae bacterium]